MQKFALTSLAAYQASAAEGVFNYYQNGMDWTEGVCATGLEQSPINLDRRKNVVRSDLTVDVSGWTDLLTTKIGLFDVQGTARVVATNHQHAIKAELENGAGD